MIPDNQEEQRLLIAEYVLGLHRGEQAVEIERWLAEDEQAARQAAHWREHWVGAAELLEPARLPPGLWRRLARETGIAVPWWRGLWQSTPAWRFASAALLVALVLAVGPLRQPAPVYTVVLQAPGEAAQPGWRITVADNGDLQLTPLAQQADYRADRSVQFWTLENNAEGPRSLGLVEPGRSLVIPAEQVGGVESGQLFELTLEPPGGSPEPRPTGPVLFIGRAVAL
ncbi:MAG TPA: anti-sigma factor [Alcanivorax sp.]|jgi:anti-sigma-K factor RskA|nr:anti-sigma factor [Alcanivorax sp.]